MAGLVGGGFKIGGLFFVSFFLDVRIDDSASTLRLDGIEAAHDCFS